MGRSERIPEKVVIELRYEEKEALTGEWGRDGEGMSVGNSIYEGTVVASNLAGGTGPQQRRNMGYD